MSKKTALITGITGQDSSYLSELLLEKDYKIYGIKRRSSTDTTWRIEHLLNESNFEIIEGDITDSASVNNIVCKTKPDELYNLAAMSFVYASFEQPAYTFNVNAKGPLYLLESIRHFSPVTKFYQASTSELFANNYNVDENGNKYQDENTPFCTNSPYSLSKLTAHYLVELYKKSYNVFACAGILMNHESVPKNTPIIVRKNNLINILPIEDLFRTDKHKYEGILDEYVGLEVWDGSNWTKILNGTCYQSKDKNIKTIQSVSQVIECTEDHVIFMKDRTEKESKNVNLKEKLFDTRYPNQVNSLTFYDLDLAKFIGFVVGDGYINNNKIRLTGCDKDLIIEMAELITKKFGWNYTIKNYGPGNYPGCVKDVWQLDISADLNFVLWISKNIYTLRSEEKRVPDFILNSNFYVKKAFFDGYYLADGRKAGWEKYEYKGFTTSSSTLCLGLILLMKEISPNQLSKVKIEYKNNRRYYRVCFRSPNSNGLHHRCKDLNEIIKIFDTKSEDGWFYDVQTESQSFAIGPNLAKIHNSPRRGEEFVTRKITKWISKFKKCRDQDVIALTTILADDIIFTNGYNEDRIFPKLRLGNISSFRDWGHSKDYVRAMHLMLQQEKPDTFVISTDIAHSVKDFCEEAFKYINIKNWQDYIVIDPKFYRPLEVDYLRGKSDKARKILGWEPTISFQDLVKEMVEADIARENQK